LASVAVTVNVYGPEAPGVPLMTPVDAFKLRPDGSEPAVIAKPIGAVPPEVCTLRLYG
jgi:hypothetical protein